MAVLSRILVPVDFSTRSRAALAYAVELAREVGSRVDVLHILPRESLAGVVADLVLDRPMGRVTGEVRAHAEAAMSRLLAEVPHEGVDVTPRIEAGDAAATIVRISTEERHDLIVLATHGRFGLADLIHGSVAKTLVTCAPCPVVTLRAAGPAGPRGRSGER